ncbi:unnamed protein product [Effrenium voratum]|nr:unnamed protein product [Effrenium voratum]
MAEQPRAMAEKKWEPMDFPPARIELLRTAFQEHPEAKEEEGHMILEPKQVHQLLFTQEERQEYGLKDFESDASAALKDKELKAFSWQDVEKFMAENL